MVGSRRFLTLLIVAASPFALLPASAGTPLLGAAQATPDRPWYIARWEHHAGGEHAAHTAAPAKVWEPEHPLDPRAIRGGQEMYEVTQFPNGEPATPEQRRQADAFVERCREAAKRHGWFDYENAARDGFTVMYGDKLHYVHAAYALDDRQLDPDRPEFLMFYDTPAGKRLAAFMFLARGPDDHGRQIGGPLTIWHFHAWSKPLCFRDRRFLIGDSDARGECANGVALLRSPEMLHVWLVKHPEGPYAGNMALTEEMQKELGSLRP
jgi:hypothetical protein